MGLFSDYVKKSEYIEGKKISIFISAKDIESYITWVKGELNEKFEASDETSKELLPIIVFHKNKTKKELRNDIVDLIFSILFDIIKSYISFIVFSNLRVYLKIGRMKEIATYHYEISR